MHWAHIYLSSGGSTQVRLSLKILNVSNARPQLHNIGKILLGNDQCPPEAVENISLDKNDFSGGEKKISSLVSAYALCPGSSH